MTAREWTKARTFVAKGADLIAWPSNLRSLAIDCSALAGTIDRGAWGKHFPVVLCNIGDFIAAGLRGPEQKIPIVDDNGRLIGIRLIPHKSIKPRQLRGQNCCAKCGACLVDLSGGAVLLCNKCHAREQKR